jgi:hypothetical protein
MPQVPATLKSIGSDEVKHTFTFNPNSIKWGYTQNTQSFDTLGGRVIQILSVKADTMTVEGDTGSKKELQRLASNIAAIMNYHLQTERPIRLTIPSRSWKFNVYITQFPSIGFKTDTISFPFQLKMELNEEFGVTTDTVLRNELNRLKKNIGYSPKWHGGDAALFEEIFGDLYDEAGGTSKRYDRAVDLSGNNNTEIAFNYFVDKGLPAFQSAGIVGNLIAESGVDPAKNQLGGGPGRGIAQWEMGARWDTYLAFAKQKGFKPLTLEPQLQFIWHELNGSESAAFLRLKDAPDVSIAASNFAQYYERPKSHNYSSRISAAKDVLNRYGSSSRKTPLQ